MIAKQLQDNLSRGNDIKNACQKLKTTLAKTSLEDIPQIKKRNVIISLLLVQRSIDQWLEDNNKYGNSDHQRTLKASGGSRVSI